MAYVSTKKKQEYRSKHRRVDIEESNVYYSRQLAMAKLIY